MTKEVDQSLSDSAVNSVRSAVVGDTTEPQAGSEETTAETSEETAKTSEVEGEVAEVSETEDSTEASDSTEEGETVDTKGQPIPYVRFKEYVDKFHKVSDELEQIKAQNAQLQETFAKFQSNPEVSKMMAGNVDPQVEEAQKVLSGMGYEPADKVRAEVEQAVLKKIEDKQAMSVFQDKVTELASKYTGKDGRPKFDVDAVAAKLQEWGIPVDSMVRNPKMVEEAYNVVNAQALADWQAKQAKKGTYTERGGQAMQSTGTDHKDLFEKASTSGKDEDWVRYLKSQVPLPE